MALLKWLIVALLALPVLLLAVGQLGGLEGPMPADLGVRDGRLKPPSSTSNSVSSQAALYPDHPMHTRAAITPLPVVGDGATTLARVKALVEATPGAQVLRVEPGYLYAQYRSRWLHFVDDVEFWHDPVAGVIQVRSASRLGREDFDVNRRRIEDLRARLGGA